MMYQVEYEVASAAFVLFLMLYMRMQYTVDSRINAEFRQLSLGVLVTDLMDVISAVAINHVTELPVWIPFSTNTIYYILSGVLGYHFIKYTCFYVFPEDKQHPLLRVGHLFLILYILLNLINLWTRCIFYIDPQKGIVHGNLYLSVYLFPFAFFLVACAVMVSQFSKMSSKQRMAIAIYAILCIAGPLVQALLFPQILLSMFAICLGLMTLAFALETPDYIKWKETVRELEMSKQQTEEAMHKAKAASEAEALFLANMSHEIRTPINSVLGMNELILRESKEPAIIEYAENAHNSGQLLLSLVNDILDFSKIDCGRMEILEKDYVLTKVLHDCVRMNQNRAKEKGLDFTLHIQEGLPEVLTGDVNRIQQIINNYITNAIKYTREGSVEVEVTGIRRGKYLSLRIGVKDTGIGIRDEDMPNLFDHFRRLDQFTNMGIEGTGLGLTISKQLAELMQGHVWVESRFGEGSSFWVEIPQRIKAEKAEETPRIEEDRSAKQNRRFEAPEGKVLVVDDVPMNLKVFSGLLRRTKMQVDQAHNGAEAVEKCRQNQYHMIFMDHMMPGMDGIETQQTIRSDEQSLNRETPQVMLTANAVAGMREQYLQSGFQDYLSKPFKGQELENVILRFLPAELICEVAEEG